MGLAEEVRSSILKHLAESSRGVILTIRVKPGEEEYLTLEGGELVFYSSEQLGGGRDNAVLVRFLSRGLKIPVSKIDIVYGQRHSLKKLLLQDVSMDVVADRLVRLVRLI
ncbi:MAG: DUF167 domain-containing protein [Desulfurococcus sp.]|nr:DUF167 domain-containing protein [Desulfurococcus sp.]